MLYLGLDGGGTKTAACILDESGTELGRGSGGPCNIISFPDETIRQSIQDAAAGALTNAGLARSAQFASVCAGVAGYTSKARRTAFHRLLKSSFSSNLYLVEPDFTVAWWGATGGEPAAVCIAGTGAVVYGRNAAGASHRVDGRGFLLGDRGSGFDLCRRGLVAVLHELEEGRQGSLLARAVLSHTGAQDADDLVEWTHARFDPGRIAGLAPIIGQAAMEGDEQASGLIGSCAALLRDAVSTTIDKLNLPSNAPIYLLGGLWQLGEVLLEPFSQGLNVQSARNDSAYGAALLAMKESRETI